MQTTYECAYKTTFTEAGSWVFILGSLVIAFTLTYFISRKFAKSEKNGGKKVDKVHIFKEDSKYTFCGLHQVDIGVVGQMTYGKELKIEDYFRFHQGKYKEMVCKRCINSVKRLNALSQKREQKEVKK